MSDKNQLFIYVDGASRGNPGHASFGICIQDEKGEILKEVSQYIGENTNNVAEYSALKCALEVAQKMGAKKLNIFTDSELVAKQFNGIYKVKHENMQSLMSQIRELEKHFETVIVTHIPRSSHPGNKRADQLANIALDKQAAL
jgi:ribonuclease HI